MSQKKINRTQVEAALRELAKSPETYAELIETLSDPAKRKDIPTMLRVAGESSAKIRSTVETVLPALKDTTGALRAGVGTSEFKSMSWVQKVLTFAALAAPGLEAIVAVTQENNFEGNSIWLTGLAVTLKAVLSAVYTVGRTKIKEDALRLGYEIETLEDENPLPEIEEYDRA